VDITYRELPDGNPSYLIPKTSVTFTRWSLYWAKPGQLDEKEISAVIGKCNFSNWMFLFFLRSNLSEFLFKKVIYHLASEFPNPDHDNDINAYREAPPTPAKPRYPDISGLDTVDSPLLHHRHPATPSAGGATPLTGAQGPTTSEVSKLPV